MSDIEEFRKNGKKVIDFMCDYMKNIEKYDVSPSVNPGYLRPLLPEAAPENPGNFDQILKDYENFIIPGLVHWQHPRFHAYFPSSNSFPSIIGHMLGDIIGGAGFSWSSCPPYTELEYIIMDWVAKALNLPEFFQLSTNGGGCIQNTASDAVFSIFIAARQRALAKLADKYGKKNKTLTDDPEIIGHSELVSKLVCYCSIEAHSCVEKAALLSLVKIRKIETDCTGSMDPEILKNRMSEDLKNDLYPFLIVCIFGSTASTFFDDISRINIVIQDLAPDIWLHIDGAYAGGALICPELRHFMKGFEKATSFNMNCNKWFLTVADCSLLWVKDRFEYTRAFIVNPLYLQHAFSDEDSLDLRHWGVPLTRRFRSLKLWLVLRSYGLENIRKYIRNHVDLASKFAQFVRQDDRFGITNEPIRLGLVCFRLKGDDTRKNSEKLTRDLLKILNDSCEIHMVPAIVRNYFSIRFCVCMENATLEEIEISWKIILKYTKQILSPFSENKSGSKDPQTSKSGKRINSQISDHTRKIASKHCAALRKKLHDFGTPIFVPGGSDSDSGEP